MTPGPREGLGRRLEAWFSEHARDLPWRGIDDPWAIWLSEVMLQQTRVETVRERFGPMLARFPSVDAMAASPLDDVLAAWSGLGYYRRARLLHAGARHVVERFGGRIPGDVEGLRSIPGVGTYTSRSIAAIAFRRPVAAIDGNAGPRPRRRRGRGRGFEPPEPGGDDPR